MSLHNSTRETRKWIILLVTKLESGSKQSVSPTNQKPSEAGFDLRGDTAKQGSKSSKDEVWARFTEFA